MAAYSLLQNLISGDTATGWQELSGPPIVQFYLTLMNHDLYLFTPFSYVSDPGAETAEVLT